MSKSTGDVSMGKPDVATARESGLVERVMDEVRRHIAANNLEPGDVLPSENAFAEKLGVSRTVGREAFRALSTLRIVETGNGRKPRVSAPDSSVLSMVLDHTVHTRQLSIQQILDVRRTLELRTASLAAVRRTPQEADLILTIARRMKGEISDSNAVMELDISLHEAIAAASRNPLYAMIIGSFRVITRQTWHIGWVSRQTEANRMANIDCHVRLAEAIVAQDALGAEALMIEHFESAISVLVRAGVS